MANINTNAYCLIRPFKAFRMSKSRYTFPEEESWVESTIPATNANKFLLHSTLN